jgi:hypothetical protein
MSRDLQLAWSCPHLTVEEVVQLGADRRSLGTRQPVAGAGTVRILVNDTFTVPPEGVQSKAQLFSTDPGPYDLVENEDVITITTSGGTFTLALGVTGNVRWKTELIIQKLLSAEFNIGTLSSKNSHLVIEDSNTIGVDSFVKVTGTAAEALGFGADGVSERQRQARGRVVFPGWCLEVRTDDITNRFPKFNSVVRGNPVFKVTYTVPPSRCLRCGANEVENDYRFDNTGQALLVDDEDLLYQACLKMVLTDKGSNPFHPWYGTSIRSRIGSKALSSTAALISDEVRKGLTLLQRIQVEQSELQVVTPKERLYRLLDVSVAPHVQDPTTFLVGVTVQNASGEPINLSIVYAVPGVVSLMGSNGLLIGTE